jgi:hypothetical protein
VRRRIRAALARHENLFALLWYLHLVRNEPLNPARRNMETWTVTVTDVHGRVRYAVEVDITPARRDSHDGPEAIITAYNNIGGNE